LLILLLLAVGCAPAAERAQARGAVLAMAQAVKVSDDSCAKYALEKMDLDLARACEHAYDGARASLIVASNSIDAWDEGRKEHVRCAIVHGADALNEIVVALRKRNIRVPLVAEDALKLVSTLGGCRE